MKIAAVTLAILLTLLLASCGQKEADLERNPCACAPPGEDAGGYVYAEGSFAEEEQELMS